MDGPQAAMLPDGRRLHLNHGPIDLIIEAFGEATEIAAAYRQAVDRFATILTELVAELPALRRPAPPEPERFSGSTARRMAAATGPLAPHFVTPMAAVAGAVADEMLAALMDGRSLRKAYVNDGGDIAFFLAQGESLQAAIGGTVAGLGDRIAIDAHDGVRGIATSGWRGRSHSLGIADAVTVLAATAAQADAAATLIANQVDLPDHPAVARAPANSLAPDSDLGALLVTTQVGALSAADTDLALAGGAALAQSYLDRGLIRAAALFLGDRSLVVGDLASRHTFSLSQDKIV